jgi:hypothetical protein
MPFQLGQNSPTLLSLIDLLNQTSEITKFTKLVGFAKNPSKSFAIFLTGILLSGLGVICSDNSDGKRDD